MRAAAVDMKPWRTRFDSPITLGLPDWAPTPGTLEYFELKQIEQNDNASTR
jgi:hypothetical protein